MTTTACPASSEVDPPATQSATLRAASGTVCYQLAPAQLTIARVARVEVDDYARGSLDVTLEPSDGAAFDKDIGGFDYQHQVAIVMFGRVLAAPTINATQFGGQVTISGLDPQTEANVLAALSG